MKNLPVALMLTALGVAPSAAQETPREGKAPVQELRLYLLDRAVPKRPLQDASASLTVSRNSRPGTTLLIPLVPDLPPIDPRDGESPLIRALIGSPYFVELVPGNVPAAAPGRTEVAPADPKKLTAAEILKRAHQGPGFMARIPESLLAPPCRATVTIRLDDLTFVSEEFQFPPVKPEKAAADARTAATDLGRRAEHGARFMELKPLVARFMEDLHQVAPAAFRDDTGVLEADRQWCLSLGRKLADACDLGDAAAIQVLSAQCEPRLKRAQDFFASGPQSDPAAPAVK